MTEGSKIGFDVLAYVGPGTVVGEWFRRYWLVVGTTAELRDIPQGIKVLDEELVLFRDRNGQLGVLGLHCPHRGTSLEYGDIEGRGIRCAYHGWLFDVSGQCLEQPAEPKGSTFHKKIKHLSYPARELGGLIFAYMGPDRNPPPPLPRYAPLIREDGIRHVEATRYYNYSWINFIENGVDPVHLSILHRRESHNGAWTSSFHNFYDIPPFDVIETPYGMKVISRKPGPTPNMEYVDEKSFALPSILKISDPEFAHFDKEPFEVKDGPHNEHLMFITPSDDDNFMIFTVNYYTGCDPDLVEKLVGKRHTHPVETRREYDKRKHGPFRGSVRHEDIIAQATQGSIAGRNEHPATSDRGVLLLRKIILAGVKTVREGGRPKGVLNADQAGEVIKFDSYRGIRIKGSP